MSGCKVRLFGKFTIERDERPLCSMDALKVQELFCYLLLFRNRPHPREQLAETLWGNQTPEKSRKQLRQILWRLQTTFREGESVSQPQELLIDNHWIQFQMPPDFWLDVAEFEKSYNLISSKKAQEISPADFTMMQTAAAEYRGDLLDGWYQEWCAFERERFQVMHLMLLDKIVQFCELHRNYETGLAYGMKILHHDYAYERAHRQLMRLYFMTGNRTQALHQYQRCVAALRDQLGVEPSESTKRLYEQIRDETYAPPGGALEHTLYRKEEGANPALENMLCHIEEALATMNILKHQIHEEIAALGGDWSVQN